jgi:hypothetical protein
MGQGLKSPAAGWERPSPMSTPADPCSPHSEDWDAVHIPSKVPTWVSSLPCAELWEAGWPWTELSPTQEGLRLTRHSFPSVASDFLRPYLFLRAALGSQEAEHRVDLPKPTLPWCERDVPSRDRTSSFEFWSFLLVVAVGPLL